MRKWNIVLIMALLLFVPVNGQETRLLQETFLEGEYFFFNEDYADALPYYLQLYEKEPDNSNIAFRIGACYLNIEGQKNLSITYLEKAVSNMSAKHKEGTISQVTAPYEALYELGRAYLINYKFDQAKDAFNRYAQTLLPNDNENISFIKQQLDACDKAKELMANPISFEEENLGALFNDEKDNFNPIVSSDGNTIAYMVSLKFYDAIMVSRATNNKWSAPVNITPELETDGDMYISCLDKEGKVLFLSKDDNYNSDIYTSTFNGSRWSPVVKLGKNINTKYWESHAYMSDDGKQLIFASDRPGGVGGLDLYLSRFVNGEWGEAVNLGPEINTPFNEDRPFITKNGEILFFSSQGHEGMGGYDIFTSTLESNGLWSSPKNIGYPLNNTDDNILFMPTNNGKEGYYSSAKNSTGFGGDDIYKLSFKK